MRNTVRQIDLAIKDLYRLHNLPRIDKFIIPPGSASTKNLSELGALLVHNPDSGTDVDVGVYFSLPVRRTLAKLRPGPQWTGQEMTAFAVAAEEISHFNCFAYHVSEGRPVTQLELEIQGEMDRFLITFFTLLPKVQDQNELFDKLYEWIFVHFHYVDNLPKEKAERYEQAHQIAKRFFRKRRGAITDKRQTERFFRWLRTFFRKTREQKISLLTE